MGVLFGVLFLDLLRNPILKMGLQTSVPFKKNTDINLFQLLSFILMGNWCANWCGLKKKVINIIDSENPMPSAKTGVCMSSVIVS